MSRLDQLINRLELWAKKMAMSVEEAIDVLEGKHPTHKVMQVYTPVENPVPVAPAPSADTVPNSENPTPSGPADASAGMVTPPSADTTGQDLTPAPDAIAASAPEVES